MVKLKNLIKSVLLALTLLISVQAEAMTPKLPDDGFMWHSPIMMPFVLPAFNVIKNYTQTQLNNIYDYAKSPWTVTGLTALFAGTGLYFYKKKRDKETLELKEVISKHEKLNENAINVLSELREQYNIQRTMSQLKNNRITELEETITLILRNGWRLSVENERINAVSDYWANKAFEYKDKLDGMEKLQTRLQTQNNLNEKIIKILSQKFKDQLKEKENLKGELSLKFFEEKNKIISKKNNKISGLSAKIKQAQLYQAKYAQHSPLFEYVFVEFFKQGNCLKGKGGEVINGDNLTEFINKNGVGAIDINVDSFKNDIVLLEDSVIPGPIISQEVADNIKARNKANVNVQTQRLDELYQRQNPQAMRIRNKLKSASINNLLAKFRKNED